MSDALEITALLIDWSNGSREALERLFPLVEKELHRLAHHYIRREQPGNTLQTTAIINETYLRLIDQKKCAGRIALISSGFPRRLCAVFC